MKFEENDRFAIGDKITGEIVQAFPGTVYRDSFYRVTFDGNILGTDDVYGGQHRVNAIDSGWFESVAEKIETPKPALRALDVLPTLKVGQKITIRTDRGEPLWGEDKAVVKFLALEPREGKEPIIWVVTKGEYRSADFSFIAPTDTIEVIED